MLWKRSLTTSFMPLTVGVEAAETAATEGGEGGVGEPRTAVAAVSGSADAVAEALREEGATVRVETSTLGASTAEGVRSAPPVPTAAVLTGAAVVTVEAALATSAEEATTPVEAVPEDGGAETVVEAAAGKAATGAAETTAANVGVAAGEAAGRVACFVAGSVTSRRSVSEVAGDGKASAEGVDELNGMDVTLLTAAVARTGCSAMGTVRGIFSCG